MKLSTVLFAVLPALALAQDDSTTSTETATTTLTKTISLAAVHTVTSTHLNTTSTVSSTPFNSPTLSSTGSSGAQTTGPAADPDSAAPALGAANVALAGVVGMVVMALM